MTARHKKAQSPINLPQNAHEVFIKRYSLRDEHGKPVEMVEDIFGRVARVVAETENMYRDGVNPDTIRKQFYGLLSQLRFMPNGRTIANAGTGSGQLANCFVLPIRDDLGRFSDSIFSTLKDAVLTLQSGGGVGFSFGRIRHKGSAVTTNKGKATGAVSFLKIYDTAFWVIGQGGGRRSACMAVLPVHHPDIYDFIHCKEQEGEIEHFNISVGITDAFMEAVKRDAFSPLIDPSTQQTVRRVRARKLFHEIVTFAHHNGEPGALFLDAANRDNPVPHQYELEATNPCGEQWLGPGENCCMASINLREHVRTKQQRNTVTKQATNQATKKQSDLFPYEVDWQKLAATVEGTVRFLDDVVDANKYVPAVPMLEEAAHRNRRIGVSIMGLADMMYLLGIAYGSKDGEDMAGQVMEFIRFYTLKASIELARQRGSFPGIAGSIYDKKRFRFRLNKSLVTPTLKLKRPTLDWKTLLKELRKYGIRNACQNTIAPTGAIATISGLEGYGCEPVFSLSYVMRTHEGIEEISTKNDDEAFVKLYYKSGLFEDALNRAELAPKVQQQIFAQVSRTGTCQDIPEVPKEIREVFVVSSDLSATQHVRMQAALQRWVSNSISKTINFPANATVADVKQAYKLAWRLGCKGITVYVTGSRKQVVLETGDGVRPDEANRSNVTSGHALSLPKGQPYVTNGTADLRGKPLVKQRPTDALEAVEPRLLQETLVGRSDSTMPGETVGRGDLSRRPYQHLRPDKCPECGAIMRVAEGCYTCPNCGYSKCDV